MNSPEIKLCETNTKNIENAQNIISTSILIKHIISQYNPHLQLITPLPLLIKYAPPMELTSLLVANLERTCFMYLRHKNQYSLFSKHIISDLEKTFKFAYHLKSYF